MAKKIYNSIIWYYDRLLKYPTEHTWNDYYKQDQELTNLIYNMHKHDLISDKVAIECYETLTTLFRKAVKYKKVGE